MNRHPRMRAGRPRISGGPHRLARSEATMVSARASNGTGIHPAGRFRCARFAAMARSSLAARWSFSRLIASLAAIKASSEMSRHGRPPVTNDSAFAVSRSRLPRPSTNENVSTTPESVWRERCCSSDSTMSDYPGVDANMLESVSEPSHEVGRLSEPAFFESPSLSARGRLGEPAPPFMPVQHFAKPAAALCWTAERLVFPAPSGKTAAILTPTKSRLAGGAVELPGVPARKFHTHGCEISALSGRLRRG